jgi:hypothetical protein
MATWADVVSYVHSNYKIAAEEPNMMKLIFETGNLRSQMVLLWHMTLQDGREEWIQIESPFGELASTDLAKAVREVGNTVCGGLACAGDFVTFRHSLPLDNLNINEFERPLALVTSTADRLESALTGGDRF